MKRKLIEAALLLTIFSLATHAQTQDGPCTPGISFWKLIDAVRVDYVSGRLEIGKLYAVCLPKPAQQSNSNYAYDPDGGGKLTTVIKGADGKTLGTLVWYAESIGGLW